MEKIGILFLLLLVSIIFITSFNKEGQKQKRKDEKSKYVTICLDGHLYFERVELRSRSIAIKLDNDGKPIKCD